MITGKHLIAAAIAGLLVLGGVALAPDTVIVQEPKAGSIASPDIPSPYLKWGAVQGVRTWPTAQPFATATTTVCAIQSPAATSTLAYPSGVLFTTSSTTAVTVTLAKAATAFATTTALGTHAIAANAQGHILASTTPAGNLNSDLVFGPNQWFVVGMQGGVGSFSPVGVCQATFAEFQPL